MALIGIDPHKRSHSACVLDNSARNCGRIRVPASPNGYKALLQWAAAWPERTWAIEGAHGLGRHLAQFLVGQGESVVDVPSTLSARVRELTTGGRKTDDVDAEATATAALHARRLRLVQEDDGLQVIAMLVERRENVVQQRTRALNQLHALLRDLQPGGANRHLSALQALRLLTRLRPSSPIARQRKLLARDLANDIRRLDTQVRNLDKRLREALEDYGTSLTQLPGVGVVLAARLLAEAGPLARFSDVARFASYAGVAPIEVASGDHSRHRLNRGGNRQLNCAIHLVALEQVRHDVGGGRQYVERKVGEGKTAKEAVRCLKRRLASRLYKTMLADDRQRTIKVLREAS